MFSNMASNIESDSSVSLTFPPYSKDFKSIIFSKGGKKLLIINKINDNIKEQIRNGRLKIYIGG
jgi:hypothetical protein